MTLEERRQIVRYLTGLGFSVVSVSGSGAPGFPFRVTLEVRDDEVTEAVGPRPSALGSG